MTTQISLTEQRAALETNVYNTVTDSFPGSRAWLRANAAEKALRAFDLAHPAITEAVATERAVEATDRQDAAMAHELEITVDEYRAMMAPKAEPIVADVAPAAAETPAHKFALFAHPGTPLCWVASDETGTLWLFDAMQDGWQINKRPYLGHKQALREVPRYNAMGTGWPHAKS